MSSMEEAANAIRLAAVALEEAREQATVTMENLAYTPATPLRRGLAEAYRQLTAAGSGPTATFSAALEAGRIRATEVNDAHKLLRSRLQLAIVEMRRLEYDLNEYVRRMLGGIGGA